MSTRIRLAASVGAVAAAATVIGLSTLAIAPPAEAEVISNVAYAPAEPAGSQGHLLDLYLPSKGGTPRPLVIWTSGSAWGSDNGKTGAGSIVTTFTSKGYAVAGVSVRSSSQARFPAQVYDIKAAIRWLRANAGTYRLDPNRFAVMGDSSGGWVADMATVTGGVASLEGNIGTTGVSSAVQAGVGFFGPTDFLQLNAQRPGGSGVDHDGPYSAESQLIGCAIQTCPDRVRPANPVNYVDRNDPPMMLLHGQADILVPHGQSVLLYHALKSNCRSVQLISVPGAGHGVGDVMKPARYGSQTVYTARGCRETTQVGSPNPGWHTIIGFLNTALQVGGAGDGHADQEQPLQQSQRYLHAAGLERANPRVRPPTRTSSSR